MEVVHVLQGHMAWVKVLTVISPAVKSHSQEEDDFCTVITTDEAARTFLVSGSLDRMIRLWDIETWTTEAIFESESSVSLPSSSRQAITCTVAGAGNSLDR